MFRVVRLFYNIKVTPNKQQEKIVTKCSQCVDKTWKRQVVLKPVFLIRCLTKIKQRVKLQIVLLSILFKLCQNEHTSRTKKGLQRSTAS